MGRLTVEDLTRLERRLAWSQIQKVIGKLPDKDLAELIVTQDTRALEAAGCTAELVCAAIGDVEDAAERDRRLSELFALDEARRDRLRDYLKDYPEVPE
jgi:hypothetical protein